MCPVWLCVAHVCTTGLWALGASVESQAPVVLRVCSQATWVCGFGQLGLVWLCGLPVSRLLKFGAAGYSLVLYSGLSDLI